MALLDEDPREIGGYRLEGRLGEGGMGVVYRARSVSGRQVAVKVIRPELAAGGDFRLRFRQELAAARRVSGAFTAPVLDADAEAGTPWLATLFIPGPSLAQRVASQGPLPAAQVRQLAAGLVEALRDIHRAGLVHRDLKPGNVLLAEDGPRVIDFGIARALDAAPLTSTGVVVGTPPFMAPEQFRRGTVGPATDVFALGSVLVYAATGHGPFDGDTVHTIGFRVVYEAPDLTGLPAELVQLVTGCLAKEATQRPTVEQLLAGFASADGPGLAATAPRTVVDAPGTVTGSAPGPVTGLVTGPVVVPEPGPPPVPVATPTAAAPATPTAPSFPPPQPQSWPEPQPPTAPAGPRQRRRWPAVALGATAVAATTALVLTLVLNQDDPDHGKPGATAGSSAAASTAATGPAAAPASTPPSPGAPATAFACAPAVPLRSGGGTSQGNAMKLWSTDYTKSCPGADVTYDSISVGAGYQGFLAGDLDFAVTDTGLTPEQVTASAGRCTGGKAVQLPLSALPVTVVYKVAGLDTLVLDAATVAGIFRGRITVWNDPQIGALNPGAVLPAAPITPFAPTSDSATTLALTQYLTASAKDAWPFQPDRSWPKGAAGQPTATKDLAAAVASANGSIAFLPATSTAQGASVVRLATGAGGTPVVPTPESAGKALESAKVVGTGADLTLDVYSAPPVAGAYPIVQLGSAVVCDRGNKPETLPALRSFLAYATGPEGQRAAATGKYGGLPAPLAERVRTSLRDLG
ncbi:serine/threonine-protein kinase [Kitasatospora misakiensis]|uniref:Serine/threonine-protein kinase n=1 Tax=Kitasatospora misakiensis TaxID=67330 RepID=A0ABW0X4H3_9ACTN